MTCTCGHELDEHDAQSDCTVYDEDTQQWCPCFAYERDRNR